MDFPSLNKSNSELLYLQIYRIIVKGIRAGELLPGAKLPSVNELSLSMGVSRMTIFQALKSLENEGWLYTIPGKGAFISEQLQVVQNLSTLSGWTDELTRQGLKPTTRLIEITFPLADAHAATSLRVSGGTPLTRIVRVRGTEQTSLAIEYAQLVTSRFPGIETFIRQGSSLYKTMREHYNTIPHHAIQSLDAVEAEPNDAELLGIVPGKPVLVSERVTFTESDEPVELVWGVHKPGFVRFRTQLNLANTTAREIVM
jgi:GntR family transcriptional regulator